MGVAHLCNTCGKRVQLRDDGTFRTHGAYTDQRLVLRRPRCLASGQPPQRVCHLPEGWRVERRFNGFCAIILRPPALDAGFAIPTVEHVRCVDRGAAVAHLFREARKLVIR